MTFKIIEGRNQGYPCIPELSERDDAKLVAPVCMYMFTTGESGYPVIAPVPDAVPELTSPLPEYMMICFGEKVNSGLPWIGGLKAAVQISDSSLYFSDKQIRGMYFGEQALELAYCNGAKVFETYYVRMKIV